MSIPNHDKKYLVVIAGPTAAGKTAMAIDVALHFGTEIISADARQIYAEMNIGTARPSPEQLATVRHHFVGTQTVTKLYGAGHFAADALSLLDDLFKEQDMVVVCGGSGLYIDALLHGVDDFGEIPVSVRDSLNTAFQEKGLQWLQQEVARADPEYYKTADINNPQRLIRALEVTRHTGKPYSSFRTGQKTERPFHPILVMINPPRTTLYERINRRVDGMMDAGLAQEAARLFQYRNFNALRTVGYKELFEHMEGKCTREEAVIHIKQHTRNYAKRQLTWFRNRGDYREFLPEDSGGVIAYIQSKMHDTR